jgi:hypothetical protein
VVAVSCEQAAMQFSNAVGLSIIGSPFLGRGPEVDFIFKRLGSFLAKTSNFGFFGFVVHGRL